MGRSSIKLDWWLILPCVLLSMLGVLVLRSVSPEYVVSQIIFMVVSVGIFLFFALADYKIFLALNIPIYLLSLVLLLTPFLFGTASRGAHRWLQFGQVSIQPSEVVKPFLLLTFAYLATSNWRFKRLWLVGAYLIPTLVVFAQPDLGTALVITVGWLAIVAYMIPKKWILTAVVLFTVLSPLTWFLLRDYQKDRLVTFVNPYTDPLGKGYNVIQSIIAVGSGGLLGRGLGHGTQSSLRFLPERQTDFIFASLSEELGFMGGLFVIAMFGILVWRIHRLSVTIPDTAERLFCLAAMTQLLFQVFVNIGMNMGVAPVTGITLPFLSAGGSSLVSWAICLGIVNSLSFRYNTSVYV